MFDSIVEKFAPKKTLWQRATEWIGVDKLTTENISQSGDLDAVALIFITSLLLLYMCGGRKSASTGIYWILIAYFILKVVL